MAATFQESILVPLSLWKDCKFDANTSKNMANKILENKALPSDVKMRLIAQEKGFNGKQHVEEEKKKSTDSSEPHVFSQAPARAVSPMLNGHGAKMSISDIVSEMPPDVQPNVNSILEKVALFPEQISWNHNQEVTIDKLLIPKSNITDILGYLMGTKSYTSVPVGTKLTRKKLVEIGVPKSWILRPLVRKRQRGLKRVHSLFHRGAFPKGSKQISYPVPVETSSQQNTASLPEVNSQQQSQLVARKSSRAKKKPKRFLDQTGSGGAIPWIAY